jgi:cytochrome c
MPLRFPAALFLLATLPSAGTAQEPTQLERGHALAERMCAECHAVGATGESRHAAAPPFRRLARLLDFDTFVVRLREGLVVAHPDCRSFASRARRRMRSPPT